MKYTDFSFEPTPWDRCRMQLTMGDTVLAAELLAMLENESIQVLEDALEDMEQGGLVLSVEGLPPAFGSGDTALRLRREAQLVKTGLSPLTLEEGDPLRLYLEELAAVPALGEEGALAQSCARGDEAAMAALTNLGLSRVVEIAGEYTGFGVLLLDLVQEGSLGLWQAVRCFRGGEYTAHRDRWIHFYMARAVTLQAHQSGIGARLRTAMEDYRMVDERLLGELGRNPTLEEIAQELHMTPEETAAVKKTLDNARLLSQAKAAPRQEEPEEEEEDQPVENTALFQMRQRILDLLSGLPEQDARLLNLRFGLEGGRPLSPEDTGRALGLTPEEVVAREAAALALLRKK